MKICSICKLEKDKLQFGKDSRLKSGLRASCKSCHQKTCNLWRKKNNEKTKTYCKNFYERNKEQILEKEKIRLQSLPIEIREKRKERYRKYHDERKEEINAKKRLLWANRSEEEKQIAYEYSSKYYENNKEKIKAKCYEYFQNLSDEKKLKKSESIKTFRHSNPEKARAWSCVGNAILRGSLIKPNSCNLCKKIGGRIHAHHEDYSLPLDVIWLCHDCHMGLHSKKLKKET